jgi:hypothetical protein
MIENQGKEREQESRERMHRRVAFIKDEWASKYAQKAKYLWRECTAAGTQDNTDVTPSIDYGPNNEVALTEIGKAFHSCTSTLNK